MPLAQSRGGTDLGTPLRLRQLRCGSCRT